MRFQGQNFDGSLDVKAVAKIVRKHTKASVRVHHQKYVGPAAPESFALHIFGLEEEVQKAWTKAKEYQSVDGLTANFWINTYDGNPFDGGKRIKIPGSIARGIPEC